MENTTKKSVFSKHNNTKCNYVFVFKTVRLTALVKDPKLYNHLPLQEIYVNSRGKKANNISRVVDTYQTLHDSSSVREQQNSISLSPL
jgi:hypothetical protein